VDARPRSGSRRLAVESEEQDVLPTESESAPEKGNLQRFLGAQEVCLHSFAKSTRRDRTTAVLPAQKRQRYSSLPDAVTQIQLGLKPIVCKF